MEPSTKRRKLETKDEDDEAEDLLLGLTNQKASGGGSADKQGVLAPTALAPRVIAPGLQTMANQAMPMLSHPNLQHALQNRMLPQQLYVFNPFAVQNGAPVNGNRNSSSPAMPGVRFPGASNVFPAPMFGNPMLVAGNVGQGKVYNSQDAQSPKPGKGDKQKGMNPGSADDTFGNFDNGSGDMNKRNKFFYKELREHLDGQSRPSIGFLNDWYFVMDPKLHVGPINRDGTFEKRVRLHFIEWIELKHTTLWICWGTLLDTNFVPVFRDGSAVYRIPGNQSSVFKTNRSFQGWNVGDDEQKKALRTCALQLKQELEAKWDGSSAAEASRLVADITLPKIPRTIIGGDVSGAAAVAEPDIPTAAAAPATSQSQPLLIHQFQPYPPQSTHSAAVVSNLLPPHMVSVVLPTPATMNVIPVVTQGQNANGEPGGESVDSLNPQFPADELARTSWRKMGYTPEDKPVFGEDMIANVVRVMDLTTYKDELIKVLQLFVVGEDNSISFARWKLTVKRFGFGHPMLQKMIDVLSTNAFNGEMSTEEAEQVLWAQKDGTYLIRYSQSTPEHFCICWKAKDKIEQMNKIGNNAFGGIEVDVGSEILKFPCWKSFIKAAKIMKDACIAESRQHFHSSAHKLPLQAILSKDSRYAPVLVKDTDSTDDEDMAETGTQEPDITDKISNVNPPDASPPRASAAVAPVADPIKDKQHTLLSFLGELTATNKMDGARFSTWAPILARIDSAPTIHQLYTLYEVFKATPEIWIKSAEAIIETKPPSTSAGSSAK